MVVGATAAGSAVVERVGLVTVAIRALYGVAGDLNDFLDRHIDELKRHSDTVVARTGRVLEAAKYGFGLGYITSTIVIAAGQILLGSALGAAVTVGTAVTLTNPIAMTCAALGAVYYGWNALSDRERNEIFDKLNQGLLVGVELIRTVLAFVIDKTKELLSSKNIEDIKRFVSEGAALFGKTLGDVTHRVVDVFGDALSTARQTAGMAIDKAADAAGEACAAVTDGAERVAKRVQVTVVREGVAEPANPRLFVPMSDREHVASVATSEALIVQVVTQPRVKKKRP